MRIGLIGLGAIGRAVVRLLETEADLVVVGALVANPAKRRENCGFSLFTTIEPLLERKPEIVVEAGGHEALRCFGPPVLRAGVDLLMASVGALADPDTENAVLEAARAGNSHAIVASGAIGALDALAAASVGGLTRVRHTTYKPSRTLLAAAEVETQTQPKELYHGTARDGALRFPESINVAAAVSLAGIGLDRTEVCVIADPTIDRNRHEVLAEGAFGTLRFEIANIPSEDNPRTGRLVAMSVVHALRRRRARLVIG